MAGFPGEPADRSRHCEPAVATGVRNGTCQNRSFDFGAQGEVPSHPELLDWLANEFASKGWNTKQLLKLLLTSDAIRRGARLTPEVKVADPHNRLYARGPRIRLDAEQVRDNVLFTSGLIDLSMGGRGVKSYQPPSHLGALSAIPIRTRVFICRITASLFTDAPSMHSSSEQPRRHSCQISTPPTANKSARFASAVIHRCRLCN